MENFLSNCNLKTIFVYIYEPSKDTANPRKTISMGKLSSLGSVEELVCYAKKSSEVIRPWPNHNME
jgi:hypothetical protein